MFFKLLFWNVLIVYLVIQSSKSQCPAKCDCSGGENVTCAHLSLTELPNSTFNLDLRNLDISFNNITKIGEFNIRKWYISSLTQLNLSHNSIQDVNKRAFVSQTHLVTLDLSWNKIQKIPPETFTYTRKLKWLSLSYNSLSLSLRNIFFSMDKLETLHLEGCGLKDISFSTFTSLDSLRQLYLSHNGLISLNLYDKWSKPLKSLTTLDISYNELQSLPKNVSTYFPALKQINIKDNKLHNESEILETGLQLNLTGLLIRNNPWQCLCRGCNFDHLCSNLSFRVDECENTPGKHHAIRRSINKPQCSTNLNIKLQNLKQELNTRASESPDTAVLELSIAASCLGLFCCVLLLIYLYFQWTEGNRLSKSTESKQLVIAMRDGSTEPA